MLYKIKFISEEVDGFFREFEIDSDSTFLDLNKAVLGYCNYPDDQMTSFYVCNREWERGQQITREDMSYPGDEENDLYLMEKTPLSDFIDDKGQRFEFVFDPFSERSFICRSRKSFQASTLMLQSCCVPPAMLPNSWRSWMLTPFRRP